MPKTVMELHGAKELEAALRELPKQIAKNTLSRALKKIAAPIAADAKSRAPWAPHSQKDRRKSDIHLKQMVDVTTTLSRRQRRGRIKKDTVEAFIGAKASKYAPHAVLVEFGSGPRWSKKTHAYRGVMPAKPFLRPAWEAGKDRALRELTTILRQEIEATARRLAKRAVKSGGNG